MILAAGRGERMRPLTDTLPKPLLKVAGVSLIEHHIKGLYRAGIREIIINHAWQGEQIEQSLGNGEQFGLDIRYSAENTALETAGGIRNALKLLGNEPFLVVNGDIWTDYPFAQIINNSKSLLSMSILAYLVLVSNPLHNPNGDFQLFKGEGGDEKQLFNKGTYPENECLTYSGIALFHPKIFSSIDDGPQALGPILKDLIRKQHVNGEFYAGDWFDIGTPERLDEINAYLLRKSL